MAMKKSVVEAINAQVGREFSAAYLYLSMAAYFEEQNLPGFAHWMRAQFAEEQAHALRLFDYLVERGAAVALQAIKEPPRTWKDPLAVMQDSLKHERAVSKSITQLYELAAKEKDYATELHLQWFITEQIEEEKTFEDLISRMKMAGDSGPALILLDRELAQRAGD